MRVLIENVYLLRFGLLKLVGPEESRAVAER